MSPEDEATFAAAMLIAPLSNALPSTEVFALPSMELALPSMAFASTNRACKISASCFGYRFAQLEGSDVRFLRCYPAVLSPPWIKNQRTVTSASQTLVECRFYSTGRRDYCIFSLITSNTTNCLAKISASMLERRSLPVRNFRRSNQRNSVLSAKSRANA